MKLIEAIRTLPLEQRVMIGAVWFKGLSVADIADQFDVSEQYVKALLHYGLRSLKSAVDGDSERADHRYAMSGGSESHAVPGQASTIAGPALGGVSR
jgi:hypothetical protein